MSRITDLADEVKTHLLAMQQLAKAATDADRDFTDGERGQLAELKGKLEDAQARYQKAKGDDSLRKQVAAWGDEIGLLDPAERKADEEARRRAAASGLVVPRSGKGLGQTVVESAAYKALLESAPPGGFGKKQRIQSTTIPLGALPKPGKALVTGADDESAGALVQNDWRGLQVGLEVFERPLTIRNVITNGTTGSDTVEYAKIAGVTNEAAPVAEATATSGSSGTKPESGFTTTKETAVVKTIAHWIPATNRALSDAAQIRTIVDAFLLYGLEEELEDQIVAGDGSDENFVGLEHVSGTQSQAAVPDPIDRPEGFGKLLALRRAKTKVRLIGRAVPTAYLIHPLDLQALDEIADGQSRFYFGGPAGANLTTPLWNLPVVESEAVSQGTAWVGDWRYAVLWDREQASISVSNSHGDFFVRNLVAILAELRAAFGVLHPAAFVKVDVSESGS